MIEGRKAWLDEAGRAASGRRRAPEHDRFYITVEWEECQSTVALLAAPKSLNAIQTVYWGWGGTRVPIA